MKILLIGSGAWPTKIFNGLHPKLKKDEIKQIGARDFLSQDSSKYDSFDCIWIATTPQNQINIITKLAQYSKVVILEKPLFTTISEHQRINSALKSFKGVAQMSAIWLYSPLWKNLKMSLENMTSILIKHKYADHRIYCSPILDWIPHDLYLLNDLGLKIHQSSELSTDYSALGNMSMRFKFENKVYIDISLEKSKQNNFSWEIECSDSSRIEIDFTNCSFIKTIQGKILTSYSDDSGFNPAASMVEDMSRTTNSTLQNFIDSHSYLINNLSFPVTSISQE